MRLFNTLCIEISARCNRKCGFCPVAYNTRPDEQMSDMVYNAIVDELASIDYRGRVELYIYNEPLKDFARCLNILADIRYRVPKACLMIATNGDYLRGATQIVQLYEAGLNQLLINCYSPGLFQKRMQWLADIPPEVDITTGNVYNNTGRKKRVIQMLDKADPAAFGVGVFRLVNRAGNLPADAGLAVLEAPIERMCVKPFRIFNINWQGVAMVCCQDYHGDMGFGNVPETSLVNLWNHPVMNTYREHLLRKDRSLPLCEKCDCHSGAYPNNVDKDFADDVPATTVRKLYELNVSKRKSPT